MNLDGTEPSVVKTIKEELRRPSGVAVDSKGNIYVSELEKHRIQVFDIWQRNPPVLFGGWGTEETRFQGPRDLALSQDDRLFVADYENRRIVWY